MAKRLTTEEFISRAEEVHPEKYSYNSTEYKSAHAQLTVTCPIHGNFLTRPANFLAGKGCKKCGRDLAASKLFKDRDFFIARAVAKHGDRYDYSKLEYTGIHDRGVIICKVHGEFSQSLNNHLKNGGCKLCGDEVRRAKRLLGGEEFLRRAKAVHGSKYDYSADSYENIFIKYRILCPEHGAFYQTPDRHLAGCGCPTCAATGPSNPELEILAFIQTLDAEAIGSDRSIIRPAELDIVSVKHKLAVEFNGLYFHSDKFRDSRYHLQKLNKCITAGYDLIQVFEDEWINPVKRDIIKSIVSARMGFFERRIYARNTKIAELSAKEARAFFNDNHIQGFTAAGIYQGLFLGDELVSAAIFCAPRKAITKSKTGYDLELARFVTTKNTQVVGGLSKLLSPYNDKSIVTYCDRRIFNAKGYSSCGFKQVRINSPEYYYVRGATRFSRHGFRKSNLESKLKYYDENLTERENMERNRYHRIYGCGTITFVRNPV